MEFIWRCVLLAVTILCITTGGWAIWWAVPCIALLMSSLRNDIVAQLIKLDKNEARRARDLEYLWRNHSK